MEFKKILVIESHKTTDKHKESVKILKDFLDKREISYSWIFYSDISKEYFDKEDLIITIGGDGVLIRVSHFVKNTLIYPINSDIKTSEGAMLCENLDYIENIFDGKYSIKEIVRGEVVLNGEKIDELFLNEIYIGCENQFHTSRYVLSFDGKEEEQRSSGIVIATGNGSSAWFASAGGEKFGYDEERLRFIVREAFKGKLFRSEIVRGEINDKKFSVLSRRKYGGCVAIDGCVVLPFDDGDEVNVGISKHRLRVVVGKSKN